MIRRAIAHIAAAWLLGWLLLGCRCPKPPPVVQPPPVVTVLRPAPCDLPLRPAKPPMFVEAIADGRLAASQFLWAEIVGYIAAAEARMNADDGCFAAQAAQP